MFHFKQFSIDDNRCAMKIGTDGVLIGAWTNHDESTKHILDIGTGSGLIALMMAQKTTNAIITGIDIDDDAVIQAKDNVKSSLWNKRIRIIQSDFNNPVELQNQSFDLIISNPPFYDDDIHSVNQQRHIARNSDALPIANLMKNAYRLLTNNGRLSFIVPAEHTYNVIGEAAINSLFLTRRCDVFTKEKTPAKRAMLEFSKYVTLAEYSTLIIHESSGNYSQQFIHLTKDFYL